MAGVCCRCALQLANLLISTRNTSVSKAPSAEVKGHGPGQEQLVFGKRNVAITTLEPIGTYAVRIIFNDGHSTGLFTWNYLAKLGRERDTSGPPIWKNSPSRRTGPRLNRFAAQESGQRTRLARRFPGKHLLHARHLVGRAQTKVTQDSQE